MFKRIKQDKKIKTFKKVNAKSLNLGVSNLDGNSIVESDYSAVLHNIPIQKPRIPKFDNVFGAKPLPKVKAKKRKVYRSGEVFTM
jgi:hypothetical protein